MVPWAWDCARRIEVTALADRARLRGLSANEAQTVMQFALAHMCALAELDMAFVRFKLGMLASLSQFFLPHRGRVWLTHEGE